MADDDSVLTTNNPQRISSLIQLHTAEYEALTTKNTYLVTVQYSLGTILVLWFALVAQIYAAFNPKVLIWASALVPQLIVLVFMAALIEIYGNTCYIERYLRPAITQLVRPDPFWTYEEHAIKYRAFVPLAWEWWPFAFCILVNTTVGVLRWRLIGLPFSTEDYLLIPSAILFVVVLGLSIKATSVRKSYYLNSEQARR
jgi:hypothetical protein